MIVKNFIQTKIRTKAFILFGLLLIVQHYFSQRFAFTCILFKQLYEDHNNITN